MSAASFPIDLFTDTAAILNNLILQYIMGCPGGKECSTALFILSNHHLVMADQPDENPKEFSMEELHVWNVEKLRKYLRNRGIAIANDTRKPDLLLKVYYMLLGYICNCVALKNNDDVQIVARRKEKLFIDGILLPFAGKLDNWLKGSYYFPDMMM